jgi:hypothetical protein
VTPSGLEPATSASKDSGRLVQTFRASTEAFSAAWRARTLKKPFEVEQLLEVLTGTARPESSRGRDDGAERDDSWRRSVEDDGDPGAGINALTRRFH